MGGFTNAAGEATNLIKTATKKLREIGEELDNPKGGKLRIGWLIGTEAETLLTLLELSINFQERLVELEEAGLDGLDGGSQARRVGGEVRTESGLDQIQALLDRIKAGEVGDGAHRLSAPE